MKNVRNHVAKVFVVLALGIGLSGLALAGNVRNTASSLESLKWSFTVSAYRYQLKQITLIQGEAVGITIDGDGYSDLDLYVYDSDGNLCGKSTCKGDVESLILKVARTDDFTIKVVNRGGTFNDYDLYVDIAY